MTTDEQHPRLPRLTGYSDLLSVSPGQKVRFMVSTEEANYQADLVRLIHGDPNPKGPGVKEEVISSPINKVYPGRSQKLCPGSYIRVENHRAFEQLKSFTLQTWIFPSRAQGARAGLLTHWCPERRTGFTLFLENGTDLVLWVGDGAEVDKLTAPFCCRPGCWHFVAAVYDSQKSEMGLLCWAFVAYPPGAAEIMLKKSTRTKKLGSRDVPLLIAASASPLGNGQVENHFNGKIANPSVFAEPLSIAELDALRRGASPNSLGKPLASSWDFSLNISSRQAVDISGSEAHGTVVNLPTRAVTGPNWSHREINFNLAKEQYNAIHFHEDDLEDAGWQADFELTIPHDMKSGIYAARLRAGEAEDYLPLFVRPRPGTATAKLAYLLPTFTYLAYANADCGVTGLLSLYDTHSDGSGVCYASRLRPLVNMRPRAMSFYKLDGSLYPRHFVADLYLTDWMEAKGFDYDIITDEDLHREGAELLRRYRAVVTGSHPEYCSALMLDGFESYLQGGGKLMYLGGNGFYWVTSVHSETSHAIEIRRWGGTETWEAEPGEYYHSTTGELGGLWRRRGRAPQQLVGVGFSAVGWSARPPAVCGPNRPYKQEAGSFDPRAQFIFENVGPEELIGDFESLGLGRGAAGDEIDRADASLGTPHHALLLARASSFSGEYLPTAEEVHLAQPWLDLADKVRADMVYFECPNGGAVFSTGSVSWLSCLSHNGYENTVSRITANVMKRFVS